MGNQLPKSGACCSNCACMENGNSDHLCKQRRKSVDSTGKPVMGNRHPLLNPLIVGHIIGHLELKELLNCRLVNKCWYSLSHRYVLQKSPEVCFFPSYSSSEMKMFFGTRNCSRSKLKKFLNVMEHSDNIPVSKYLLQDVIPSDPLCQRFLQICGSSVNSLQIGFADGNLWEAFLKGTPNLEELNIFVADARRWKNEYEFATELRESNLFLQDLHTLTFTTRSIPFLLNFFKATKNIDTITINVGPNHGDNELKLNLNFKGTEELQQSLTRESLESLEFKSCKTKLLWTLLGAVPNLRSLNLNLRYRNTYCILNSLMKEENISHSLRKFVVSGEPESTPHSGKIHILFEDLSCLQTSKWTLDSIQWSSFLLPPMAIPHFMKFLDTQRHSLRSLTLPCLDTPCIQATQGNNEFHGNNHENPNHNPLYMEIPRMTKLQELTLQCLVPPKIDSWSYTFPVLKRLEVKKLYFSLPELEHLFPVSNSTCPCTSLRELLINFKMFSPGYMRRLEVIFPEVERLHMFEPTVDVLQVIWELWSTKLTSLTLQLNQCNEKYNYAIVGSKREKCAVGPNNDHENTDDIPLYSIANLKRLEELFIKGPIFDTTVKEIIKLRNITRLEITSPFISEASVAYLKETMQKMMNPSKATSTNDLLQ